MKTIFAPLVVALLAAACASTPASGPTATAKLAATSGNTVTGTVTFTQTGDVVRVSGEVSGLAPNTVHGFHIHEKGDCSSGDGMSTGGHFNPLGQTHGAIDHGDHHAGDLASLTSDANGVAKFSYTANLLSVGSGATDVIGHGLIVHKDADDFKTQPTGNSGARVACAVIVKG